jgi:hypothetical protein
MFLVPRKIDNAQRRLRELLTKYGETTAACRSPSGRVRRIPALRRTGPATRIAAPVPAARPHSLRWRPQAITLMVDLEDCRILIRFE